ncbi:hypothetical protein AX774_g4271 [Zancudomyces culisetae]|uniref:Uncharacterized protein n=1 Tax=Zancudomyces culisetae TaxID=1213189 RepID=A0A1R1PMW2_ZANCU|nr:hypothetical protein AX774_g4271 [Zancudomyces culisetae]|eukprot:OMH82253.1 hypothetical protein AX774_g4271 [Zancudomyces culisetae]
MNEKLGIQGKNDLSEIEYIEMKKGLVLQEIEENFDKCCRTISGGILPKAKEISRTSKEISDKIAPWIRFFKSTLGEVKEDSKDIPLVNNAIDETQESAQVNTHNSRVDEAQASRSETRDTPSSAEIYSFSRLNEAGDDEESVYENDIETDTFYKQVLEKKRMVNDQSNVGLGIYDSKYTHNNESENVKRNQQQTMGDNNKGKQREGFNKENAPGDSAAMTLGEYVSKYGSVQRRQSKYMDINFKPTSIESKHSYGGISISTEDMMPPKMSPLRTTKFTLPVSRKSLGVSGRRRNEDGKRSNRYYNHSDTDSMFSQDTDAMLEELTMQMSKYHTPSGNGGGVLDADTPSTIETDQIIRFRLGNRGDDIGMDMNTTTATAAAADTTLRNSGVTSGSATMYTSSVSPLDATRNQTLEVADTAVECLENSALEVQDITMNEENCDNTRQASIQQETNTAHTTSSTSTSRPAPTENGRQKLAHQAERLQEEGGRMDVEDEDDESDLDHIPTPPRLSYNFSSVDLQPIEPLMSSSPLANASVEQNVKKSSAEPTTIDTAHLPPSTSPSPLPASSPLVSNQPFTDQEIFSSPSAHHKNPSPSGGTKRPFIDSPMPTVPHDDTVVMDPSIYQNIHPDDITSNPVIESPSVNIGNAAKRSRLKPMTSLEVSNQHSSHVSSFQVSSPPHNTKQPLNSRSSSVKNRLSTSPSLNLHNVFYSASSSSNTNNSNVNRSHFRRSLSSLQNSDFSSKSQAGVAPNLISNGSSGFRARRASNHTFSASLLNSAHKKSDLSYDSHNSNTGSFGDLSLSASKSTLQQKSHHSATNMTNTKTSSNDPITPSINTTDSNVGAKDKLSASKRP